MKRILFGGLLLVVILAGLGGMALFDGSGSDASTPPTAVFSSPPHPTTEAAPPTAVPPFDESILVQVNALGEEGAIYAQAINLYQANCTVCHGPNGEGNTLGPALQTDAVQAMTDELLFERINLGVAGTIMAGWEGRLATEEIKSLVTFLQDWDELSEADWARADDDDDDADELAEAVAAGDELLLTAVGGDLFSATCTACHGETGEGGLGPALNSQQFLTARTDEQIAQAIQSGGHMPSSVMPAFEGQLSGEEIMALVSFIRSWEPTAPVVENPRGTAQGQGGQGMGMGQGGQGMGQGRNGQGGQGQGGPPWRTNNNGNGGAQAGMPNTAVSLEFTGVVVSLNSNQLTFQTADGQMWDAMLGPPWFWSEKGIALQTGDQIRLSGFESPDHMEVNWIENVTSGVRLELRTADGMPVWQGGG